MTLRQIGAIACVHCGQVLNQVATGPIVCQQCGAVNAVYDDALSGPLGPAPRVPIGSEVTVSEPFSSSPNSVWNRLGVNTLLESQHARLALAAACGLVILLAAGSSVILSHAWQVTGQLLGGSETTSRSKSSQEVGTTASRAGNRTTGSGGSSSAGGGGGNSGGGGGGPAAPTIAINAAKPSFAGPGVTTISWSTANASSCTASGAWSGSQPTSGSASTGVLYFPATYALTCSGPGGSTSASATVAVSYTPPSPSAKSYGLALSNPQWLSSPDLTTHLDEADALSVAWVRVAISWCSIQSSGPTTYNWTAYDKVVNAAKAHGLYVLAQIGCTPSWANGGQAWDYPPNSANMGAWANFTAQVVKHYSPLGVKDYEIWNEPNNTYFFMPAPNAATYVTMLKAAYTAIKQADANAIVVTGGIGYVSSTDPGPTSYLQSLYADGAKGYFDVVGWHPYPYSWPALPSNSETGWSYMVQGHSIMAANGDGAKPIWATEYGYPSAGASWATEAQQSAAASAALNLWNSYSWSGAFFWYNEVDYQDATSGTGAFFGLYRQDWSHKPAWATYHAAVIP